MLSIFRSLLGFDSYINRWLRDQYVSERCVMRIWQADVIRPERDR